jgi:hypothetical protein
LPPEQIDNTGRIIENTRRTYSRTRIDVETEINEAMLMQNAQLAQQSQQSQPNAKKEPDAPLTTAQAKLWPIDAGAIAVEGLVDAPLAQTAANSAPGTTEATPAAFGSEPEAPAKKKRKRTRKRKSAASSEPKTTETPAE